MYDKAIDGAAGGVALPTTRPNVLALGYLDDAIKLEEECRELRRILTGLLIWLSTRDELFTFASELANLRWPAARRWAA
jgi:hypothetical protein